MRLIEADKFKGKVIATHTGGDVIKLVAIDDVPTAFDIEKVMEFLEEREQLAYKRYIDTPYNSPCYVRYQTQYIERKQILDFMKGLFEEIK